jgi:hypothetical protein
MKRIDLYARTNSTLKFVIAGLLTLALSACDWWGNGDDGGASIATYYTIGGTVSGLNGTVVLATPGANNSGLSVSANGNFTFGTAMNAGAIYNVIVVTQPTNQTCTVSNGSGTANANVTSVAVTCITRTVTIGGTVSGLNGTLVLRNNGVNDLTVSANGSFTFSAAINAGTTYAVTVFSKPSTQSCSVTNGGGTANSNVTNVSVTCTTIAPATVTIGGTISGLIGTVVLQNNGGDNLGRSADGAFVFATPITFGTNYAVTVLTQPAGQTCSVTNGSGTGNANVTNVSVSCGANGTVSGAVTGLTGAGMVLRLNGANDLTVAANATSFQFAATLATNDLYRVVIVTQPAGLTCTILRGTGFMPSTSVIDVQIDCVPRTTDVLMGTYTVAVNGTALRGYFTFFDIGTYVYGTHDAANPACTGLEHGAYNFNASAQTLTFVNAVIDHNGSCGVHNDTVGATPPFISGTSVAKNVTTKIITGTFANTGGSGTSALTFTPVPSTTGQLLGAWTLPARQNVLVFNGDGTAFFATAWDVQNSLTPQPAGFDDVCLTGVAPTASSGNFMSDFSGSCTVPGPAGPLPAVSTNGAAGLGPTGGPPASYSYVVTGDSLTLTVGTSSGTYQRVVPN